MKGVKSLRILRSRPEIIVRFHDGTEARFDKIGHPSVGVGVPEDRQNNLLPVEIAADYIRHVAKDRESAFNAEFQTRSRSESGEFHPVIAAAMQVIYARERAELQRSEAEAAARREPARRILEKFGVEVDALESTLPHATRYTTVGGRVVGSRDLSLDNVLFRGEEEPPRVIAVEEVSGERSGVSRSVYPVIKVSLDNGSHFLDVIRISDHPQVSANAPRYYEFDYRGSALADVIDDVVADMQGVAEQIWSEQKEICNADNK